MAWYTGWHSTYLSPQDVSWSKYSTVTYSFATTTPDVNTLALTSEDTTLLPEIVQNAHANGVKAMLTVGGWSGSQYFSTAVATAANRTAFVGAVLGLVKQYNLDGIDFDWEYPGRLGVSCNMISDLDSANFLTFLQTLRAEPAAKNLTISAAVGIPVFTGSNGSPMTDVSAFASVLDFVEIMDYDVWGTWSGSAGVGPNAPLNDSCSTHQAGSAVSAVDNWTKAGFPANQIVLGVASYGHSFLVTPDNAFSPTGSTTLASYPLFNTTYQPEGDSWDVDAPAGTDQCGNATTGGWDGLWYFRGLFEAGGFLTGNGTVASGIDYRFDSCSQTPYVYNPNTEVMVSFDNADSFAAKGNYIKQAGLRGFAMWEAAGDYEDILLDAINNAIGVQK
ncbi:glycoside hydrolase [Sparassis latifolia]